MISKLCDRSPPARAVRLLAVVAGAVLLMGVAPLSNAASYGTVDIRYRGDGADGALYDWISIKVDADRSGSFEVDTGSNASAPAGEYAFSTDPAGSWADNLIAPADDWFTQGGLFKAYCIDVAAEVELTGHLKAYTVKDLQDVVVGGSVGAAYPTGRVLGATSAAYLREFYALHFLAVDTDVEAEAFMAGVWEIMYDDPGAIIDGMPTGYDFTTGYLQAGNFENAALANTWLDDLGKWEVIGDTNKVFALTNDEFEDVSFVALNYGGIRIVPEPLTMVGVLMGIAGIGGYVVRKRKRA